MSIDIANKVIYRLIKYNPNFKSFEENKEINDFIRMTVINSLYRISESNDSYYKISPEEPQDITSSSSSFDISPRAKELGIKLKGLIDSGEVIIASCHVDIMIIVNIFKISNSSHETKGSIIINIVFPKQRYPPLHNQNKLSETFEIADKITKGFKLGNKFASAVILECIIKKGITYILAGPICAAIGFND